MSAFRPIDCPFCHLPADRILDQNAHAVAVADAFPVSPGHSLVIPKRHHASFFELSVEEITAVYALLHRMKARLDDTLKPAGYNVGINIGEAAGQTVGHVHVHLIPPFLGDVVEPRGGVRNVIPGKGLYDQPNVGEPVELLKAKGTRMTIEISKNHLDAVVNHLIWQNKAQLYFRRFMQELSPMPWDDRFWKLLDHFRNLVKGNLDRKHGDPIAGAAREFFRLALVAEPPLKADEYLMEEALQWFQVYTALKGKLDGVLASLYEFQGDSFGDLIDSIPLGGRELCERALKTAPRCPDGFLHEEEVSDAVKALPEPWRKLVGHALFVASRLEDMAESYLIAWIRSNLLTLEQSQQIESWKID